MIILLKLRRGSSLIDNKIVMQKQSTFYGLKPENSTFILVQSKSLSDCFDSIDFSCHDEVLPGQQLQNPSPPSTRSVLLLCPREIKVLHRTVPVSPPKLSKYPHLKSDFNVIFHFVLEGCGHRKGQFDDIKIIQNIFLNYN